MIVLMLDLLAPTDRSAASSATCGRRGTRWCLMRVLDPAEVDFTFDKPVTFVDMETGRDLYVDPAAARAQYKANFARHADEITKTCRDLGIDLYDLTTSQPLERALFDFLQSRVHAGRHVTRSGNQ
jgi:uncharacterized protein (DUF58 family)